MAAVFTRYITLGRSIGVGRVCTRGFFRHNHRASQVSLTVTALHGPLKLNKPIARINSISGIFSMSQTRGIHSIRPDSMAKSIENCSHPFSTSSTLLSSSSDESKGSLIYQGNMNIMVRVLKAFSLSTSIMGCSIIPLTMLYSDNTAVNVILSTMAMFTIFTPLLLHYITKGYVTQIYFNRDTDTYTVHTYSITLQQKNLEFTPDDVKVPTVPSLFASIIAKGKSLLINDALFLNPNDMLHLKGYDKLQGDMTLEQLKELYMEDEKKLYASEDEDEDDEDDVKTVKKK